MLTQYIDETLSEINEERKRACRDQVKKLIHSILDKQNQLAAVAEEIIKLKKELAAVGMPQTATLEV